MCKEAVDEKGLKVIAEKIKIIICGSALDLLLSFHALSNQEKVTTPTSTMATNTGCIRNAVDSKG